jgi:formiminotetrahydrofolate cyclodeaminase
MAGSEHLVTAISETHRKLPSLGAHRSLECVESGLKRSYSTTIKRNRRRAMPDMDDFLDRLASGDPVPGGGSVAGFEIAMGAALVVMVCELTLGREKFASVENEVREIRDRAVSLKAGARKLVDADADAFGRVSSAMKLPRTTDEEKSARREAVQAALKGAVDPPLQSMLCAKEAMVLASQLAPLGNPNAISDVGSAALALDAGYYAAKLNVEINLASIKDEEFIERIRSQMPSDDEIDRGRSETVRLVLQSIRKTS